MQQKTLLDMDEKETTQPKLTCSTILLRQINPTWYSEKKGRITSQAFFPTKKDKGKLSSDRGDLVTAEDSFIQFTRLGSDSIGVYGVSVCECLSLGLSVCFDPDPPDRPFHTSIDLGDKSKRTISKKLLYMATKRGWLYRPDNLEDASL